jgi:type I restriction enzyme S subunit
MPKTLTSSDPADVPLRPWPLPKSWIWSEVECVGTVQVGKQLTQHRRPGDRLVKYVRAANISPKGIDLLDLQQMGVTSGELARYSLQPGDVLLTEASGSSSHVGKSALWGGEVTQCTFQNTVIRFRPHAVSPEYAQLVFRCFAVTGVFAKVARGVGIQHLGGDRFAKLSFPLAPLAAQKQIVAELTRRLAGLHDAQQALDSALKGLSGKTDVLLELAMTGRLVGRMRPAEKPVTPPSGELPLTIGSNHEEKLLVPKHWQVVRIADAGEARLGRQRTPAHERGEHLTPYLRVANVFEDRIDGTDILRMNFTPAEQKIYRLQVGDLLLNEGQSPALVGRPALYRGKPPRVCFQNHLLRFRAGPRVDARFALLVFRHYYRSGRFTRMARGSTNIVNLGVKRFAEMPFPLPPLQEQRAIVETVEHQLAEDAQQAAAVMASLEKLRPAELDLLQAAFSGDLVADSGSGESAADLMLRLGPPPPEKIKKSSPRKTPKPMKTNRTKKDLVAVLKAAGGRLSAEDLFESAGYDRDASEDIERFYLKLRAELRHTIREKTRKKDQTILEAV